MITPEWLEYKLNILQVHKDLQESILRDVVRRIMKTNYTVTDTAAWQSEKLQQAGMVFDDVTKQVAKHTEKSKSEIEQAFADAQTEVFNYADEVVEAAGYDPVEFKTLSPKMKNIWKAALAKTVTEARNLTKTTANTSMASFISAADLAHMQISSGAFTYQQAIKNAIKAAAYNGTIVTYPSGHKSSLDAAMRRAVLTGVNQTAGTLQDMRANDMDVDIMELTAHSGARPKHAQWQGKLVSRSGQPGYLSLEDIGYGTAAGFMGANCRHGWFMFFPGISTRKYTQAQLDKLANETVTYNDKQIPVWEARDMQRSMERSIRKYKRELVAIDEAMKNVLEDEERIEWQYDFYTASKKLKSKEAQIADFCKQTGLRRDRFREQMFAVETENGIKNFGKSVSQKATSDAKAYYEYWRKSIGAKNTPETLEKYYQMKYNDKKEYRRLQKYALSVKKGDVTPMLGYADYKQTAEEIEKTLIGVTTVNGITIKDYSAHFVSRAIGRGGTTKKSNRAGVLIDDIKYTLENGTVGKTQVDADGKTSVLITSEKCGVTVNPDKKCLVQTTPKR